MDRSTTAFVALLFMIAVATSPRGAGGETRLPASGAFVETPTATPCPAPPRTLASPTPVAPTAANGLVRGDDYQGVIFAGTRAEDLADLVVYGAWSETWKPSATEVAALEAGIEAFLCAEPGGQRPGWNNDQPLWQRIATYKRQYAGVVVDGRKLVVANFFCSTFDESDDWLRYPVIVLDGGDCFFSLTYDPADRTYDHLMINGEA